RRCRDDAGNGEIRDVRHVRHHTLVDAASRRAIQRGRIDAFDAHAVLAGERQDLVDATVAPAADAKTRDPAGPQRLEDRIDAVDDHKCMSRRPSYSTAVA